MPRSCTPHAAAQLQPIHALRPACGARSALLPVDVGAMNIHDVRDRCQIDDSVLVLLPFDSEIKMYIIIISFAVPLLQ